LRRQGTLCGRSATGHRRGVRLIPARLIIDSPAAPDRHGGRRPAIHAYAARSKKIVDAGLRRHDAESGSRASIIMFPGISAYGTTDAHGCTQIERSRHCVRRLSRLTIPQSTRRLGAARRSGTAFNKPGCEFRETAQRPSMHREPSVCICVYPRLDDLLTRQVTREASVLNPYREAA